MFAATLPQPCGVCGQTVRSGDRFAIGHIEPRGAAPERTWDLTNMRVEHLRCSHAGGVAGIAAKARAEALREYGVEKEREKRPKGNRRVPPDGYSDSPRGGYGTDFAAPLSGPSLLKGKSPEIDFDSLWLADLADIPADASLPRAISPPHPQAVGSHGALVERWAAENLGIRLRWWQRLALRRQLEHDADGRLVWRQVVESTPRRSGKSVKIRVLALARIGLAELFGEVPQLVLHTGRDTAITAEVMRRAWPWAEAREDWKVRRANGEQTVESPNGSRWIIKSTGAVYGYDVNLALVDEAWDVAPGVVDDGLEPALLERTDPQLVLTSTAHRRATSLMRGRMSSALEGQDDTLLLWWAAPEGADIEDPDVWRAASPHWSAERESMVRSKLARALSGETEPDDLDPDPMQSFMTQHLNWWPGRPVPRGVGDPLVSEERWEAARADRGGAPMAVGIESWYSSGAHVSVAYAGGVVTTTFVPDVRTAASVAAAAGAPTVLAGKSIAEDPALVGLSPVAMRGTSRACVLEFVRLLGEGELAHDGSPALTEQVLALRATQGTEGPTLRPGLRTDAIKSALWALQRARAPVSDEEPRIF